MCFLYKSMKQQIVALNTVNRLNKFREISIIFIDKYNIVASPEIPVYLNGV